MDAKGYDLQAVIRQIQIIMKAITIPNDSPGN